MSYHYDTAQICKKGHILNPFSKCRPQDNRYFCPDCGCPVISKCPICEHPIEGGRVPNLPIAFLRLIFFFDNKKIASSLLEGITPPLYCSSCGKPYPWTQGVLDAADELISESNLSNEEKQQAQEDIRAIAQNTPRAESAAKRLKRVTAGDLWNRLWPFLVQYGLGRALDTLIP